MSRDPRPVWLLTGLPVPTPVERAVRTVGLRVLRLPGRRSVVLAGSVEHLRELFTRPASSTAVRHVRVVVTWWRAPRKGWAAGVGAVRRMVRHRVRLPRWGRGMVTACVRVAGPVPLAEVVTGILPALGAGRPLPAPVSPEVTATRVLPAYLPADARFRAGSGPLIENADIRPYDVVLTPPEPAIEAVRDGWYAVSLATERHAVTTAAATSLVLADARRINPGGRWAGSYRPDAARARLDFGVPARRSRGWRTLSGPLDGPGLSTDALAALRRVAVVQCGTGTSDGSPVATAGLLVQVAMTGAVLYAPDLPAGVAGLLVPELRDLITQPVDPEPLDLELRSVRQRRAAMRGHDSVFALPRATVGALPELNRPPSVSAVLITRRPDRVLAALRGILSQTYPELEIVLGLHGIRLPSPARRLLVTCGRPVQIVDAPATETFGVLLGRATGRASGTLITKFDDDDTYGPEHVWDLVLARHYSGATLVGKGAEFVHLESLGVTVRRPSGVAEAVGELVAGGTMLLSRGDLEAVGGWRPVPRSVDRGLIDRLRQAGALIYRTHPFGYLYHRRTAGHTWRVPDRYFLDDASARWVGVPPAVVDDDGTGSRTGDPGDRSDREVVGPGPPVPTDRSCAGR